MTDTISLLARLAATVPLPATSPYGLQYIVHEVEWFYGEMFIGMTVLYGFIAAVFGYFIPRNNLKRLQRKIATARAGTQRELDRVKQLAAAVRYFNLAITAIMSGAHTAELQSLRTRQNVQNPMRAEAARFMLLACHRFFLAGDTSSFTDALEKSINWLSECKSLNVLEDPRISAAIAQAQDDYKQAVKEATEGLGTSLKPPEKVGWFLELIPKR